MLWHHHSCDSTLRHISIPTKRGTNIASLLTDRDKVPDNGILDNGITADGA